MCWREMLPILITFVTFTFGYSLTAVITRYRLSLYPLLEIVAAGLLFVWSGGVYFGFPTKENFPSLLKRSEAQTVRE